MRFQLNTLSRKFLLVALFSIAMALIEAVVVVYLRFLYHPYGFSFPLPLVDARVFTIELLRELATLVMLAAVSLLAGSTFSHYIAWFLFSFGVWDIFYYIWLKVLLDWPTTLLDWDILFLIPITWLGPVLAPIICSVLMILLAVLMLHRNAKGQNVNLKIQEWALLILGSVFVLYSFMVDYAALLLKGGFHRQMQNLAQNPAFQRTLAEFVPSRFQWELFSIGCIAYLAVIVHFCLRTPSANSNQKIL